MPPRRWLKQTQVAGGGFSREEYPEKELTEKIIGCAIAVHRELGPGYVEPIYQRALAHELAKNGLAVQREVTFKVFYDGIEVGRHKADLLVEKRVVVELKSVEVLADKHMAQTISTLKAVGAKVGLLLNFDEALLVNGIKRVVLSES